MSTAPTKPYHWLFLRNTAEVVDPIEIIASEFGLDPHELRTGGHEWRISRPRYLAMYLLREQGWTLKAIAKRFGGLHHTSVIAGIRTIKRLMLNCPTAKEEINRLRAKLGRAA